MDGKKVIDGDKLRQRLGGYSPRFIRWLSRRWMPLGKRIAVLGGGLVGCELAVFLAERGRQVTILVRQANQATAVRQRKQLDWLGIVLLSMGLAMVQYVLEEGNRDDWFDSRTISFCK